MKLKNIIHTLWIIPLILALVLTGCSVKQDDSNIQKVCTMDAKICADGSAVGRNPENGCAFDPCPELDLGEEPGEPSKIAAEYRNYAANSVEQCAATTFICDVSGTEQFFDQSGCGCEATDPKIYTSQDLDECSRIKYMCIENYVPFTDEIGCGCKFSWEQILIGTGNVLPDDSPSEENAIECTADQRGENIACTMDYNPVCGWNDKTIQCFAYPCAQTYGNGCTACSNPTVEYYTPGICPATGS